MDNNITKDEYKEGVKKMITEGLEFAQKIINYIKDNKERLFKLERIERKKTILNENEDFITFSQIHPIVYEYLVVEQIFNKNAFKKYINAAFGYPKSKEDQILLAKDKRNVYYLKNKQYALYYKYLLQENNQHVSLDHINKLYNDMVDQLNQNTKKMLDKYDEAEKKASLTNETLNEEKKNEIISILKQKLLNDTNNLS